MKEKESLRELLDLVEQSCGRAIIGRKVILTYDVAQSWIPLIEKSKKLLVDKENVYIYFSNTYGWCVESEDSGRGIADNFDSLDDAISFTKEGHYKIVRVEQ